MNAGSAPPRPGARSPAGANRGLAGTTFSTADLVGLRPRAAGLSLDVYRSSRGGRSGARLSRFRGRGMEYSESRIYLPGDDIRSIDWRVTARTGRTHTKLFHEERDRPVLFVVDLGETHAVRHPAGVQVGRGGGGRVAARMGGGGGRRPRRRSSWSAVEHAAESRIRRRESAQHLRCFALLPESRTRRERPATGGGIEDALARAHRVDTARIAGHRNQ